MAVPTGLEPAVSSVTDWHVNHYTTRPSLKHLILYHNQNNLSSPLREGRKEEKINYIDTINDYKVFEASKKECVASGYCYPTFAAFINTEHGAKL